MTPIISNILDPIYDTLPPDVWDDPGGATPTLKAVHTHWITKTIYGILEEGGYSNPHQWLRLYLTGSLTTCQYSRESDCDIGLFVQSDRLPEWSRAEMIGLMISGTENQRLPGTTYELQAYVVAKGLHPAELYKPGLRAGYSIDKHQWVTPPDRRLNHDVQAQENGFYAYALEQADKMDRMLRYEPDKAIDFWHQIHRRRMRDQKMGKGDHSESNIVYKFLAKRDLFPRIADLSGEHVGGNQEQLGPKTWVYDSAHCPGCGNDMSGVQGPPFGCPRCGPMAQVEVPLATGDDPEWDEFLGDDRPTDSSICNEHGWISCPVCGRGPHHMDPRDRTGKISGWQDVGRSILPQDISSPTAIERGQSRPVSQQEFDQLAAEGAQQYEGMQANSAPIMGLEQNWPHLLDYAYQQTRQPWGGATIDAHTGRPIESNADAYALSVKGPQAQSVSIPPHGSPEQFAQAMSTAKEMYRPILERQDHHLGVFHDADQGRIDFDPVVVVHHPHDVEAIGAHTHATGGAYHFKTGEGLWPPHVVDGQQELAA